MTAPVPVPWQQRPRLHLVLTTTSILCIIAMYIAVSRTERSSIDLYGAVGQAKAVCAQMELEERGAVQNLIRDAPPTRPPSTDVHVHFVLCPANDFMDTIDDGIVNGALDALAAIRGLLMQASSSGSGRGMINMVDEIPSLSATFSKASPIICRRKSARKKANDKSAPTAEEAASAGSLVVGATTQQWVVFTAVHASPVDATTCKRDHNRRMWCSVVALPPRADDALGASNATGQGEGRTSIRKWTGSVIASILGVSNFRDVGEMRRYLAARRYVACRYVVAALESLSTVLEAAPTMPLAISLGNGITEAVDAIAQERRAGAGNRSAIRSRLVRSAEQVEQCVLDPSLLPQMFLPLDHLLAIHMSFLLPVVVAFLAGVALSLKEWKRQRKARRAAQATS